MTQRLERLEQSDDAAPEGSAGGRDPASGLDRFERGVVFRVARGAFLVAAALGVLVLVGGAAAWLGGLWRPPIPAPVPPPEVADPQVVTVQQAEAWLQGQAARSRPPSPSQELAGEPRLPAVAAPSPEAKRQQELSQLLTRLRGLLPGTDGAWEDSYIEVCRTPSAYGCLRSERQLQRKGLFTQLKEAMEPVAGADVLPALRELCAVLEQTPPGRRLALLPAVVAVRQEQLERYREAVRKRDALITEGREQHERQVAEQEADKQHLRSLGLSGTAAGLALLVLVSLFLTHFAIERHLRLLRLLPGGSSGGPAGLSGR